MKKSTQRGLRMPKNSVGGVGGLLVSIIVDLLDAPLADGGNDAQVNIGLVGINALSNGVATPIVANQTPQVVNLLALQSTAEQYAASLPAGSYDTLQLVVDPTTSSVVYQGQTYPVQFGSLTSDPTSYVGIDAPATFGSDGSANITLTADFNVLESVALDGAIANIDPQLVTATNASDVSGTILNAAGLPVSSAVVLALDANGNVLNSTISANDGTFTLHALSAGSATLVVQNAYVSASGESVSADGADATAPSPLPLAIPGGNTINIGSLTD
ncbi:MAG TPA: DUF4382 domain-containing protein [Candidatus Sulfotelmatobacter sp.]|nr:DUF4382 domain-containing protein [Candidatus Sulfotelmatobacter sp.]